MSSLVTQVRSRSNESYFSIVRAGDAIYVRVGDHDLTQRYGSPGAQTLRVATTYIHHNHNSQTLDNDIALLKLHGEADLKEGVCLTCLPARGTSQVRQRLAQSGPAHFISFLSSGHGEEVHGDWVRLHGRK